MSTMHLAALIAKAKQNVDSRNRAKTVKPAEGTSRWRILPPVSETANFYADFGQHFIKDMTGAVKAVYVCVDKTFGKPCSICSALEQAIKQTTDDVMLDTLTQAKSSGRVLLNALHTNGPNPGEPVILELAPGTFADFVNILNEWGGEMLDLSKGRDIIIERTGKGKQTKYSVTVAGKETAVPNATEVMKKATDLDKYVRQESEEGMRRALTNVAAVAGLLPPEPASAAPSMRDVMVDEDVTASIPTAPAPAAPAAPVVSAAPVAPAIEVPATPAPAPAAAAPAPAAAAAAPVVDSELASLIAALG